jgi:hypothetical protein
VKIESCNRRRVIQLETCTFLLITLSVLVLSISQAGLDCSNSHPSPQGHYSPAPLPDRVYAHTCPSVVGCASAPCPAGANMVNVLHAEPVGVLVGIQAGIRSPGMARFGTVRRLLRVDQVCRCLRSFVGARGGIRWRL